MSPRPAQRAPRSSNWEIEQVRPDLWEIRQGRKSKGTKESERAAIEFVRTRRQPPQKVVVVEDDGYRLDITRKFDQGGLR